MVTLKEVISQAIEASSKDKEGKKIRIVKEEQIEEYVKKYKKTYLSIE
ncbi:40568_t:CDS:1, partial [Gigaspora margarita]